MKAKTEFQAFLMAEFKKYEEKVGGWRPSIASWAHYLGVSEASLDHWIMGRRTPDLPNAIRLAQKLGWQVYDLLSFEHYVQLDDPILRQVAESWEIISDETRHEILKVIRNRTGGG